MEDISHVGDEQLADEIVTWAGRVAAGEAELLWRIGEFDRREAWGGTGMLSCAHWLSWRTGLGLVAAREKVRVARALGDLPQVADAFAAGRLSYSQVRAITRVATVDEQQRWIDVARSSTAGQLDRLVRGVRRARKVEEDAADAELAAWRMRATKSYDDDGNAVYRIVLPAEQAAVLDAALEAARARLEQERREAEGASAEASRPQAPGSEPADANADASGEATSPQPPTLAESLLELARTALQSQPAAAARRTRATLTAQVDPLTGWGRLRDGELLPPSSLSAVLKSLPGRGGVLRLRPLTADDLRAHDLGRDARLPSPALRELLGTIDGECCRFPGCTRRRKLHAHHVRTWSSGGRTDLANLVLVCARHHTLVHQHGYVLALDDDRTLNVTTADGTAVRRLHPQPWRDPGELDPDRRITATTLPPEQVDHLHLHYAVSVLCQQSA